MPNPYIATVVILTINFSILQMNGIINSQLGNFGVLLYFPALFFLPATIYLERKYAIFVLFITGFGIDYHFNTVLGFHSFALIFFHLIAKDLLRLGQSGEILRPHVLQVIANAIISFGLFFFLLLEMEGRGKWTVSNFLVDFIVSTALFWFLSNWFDALCNRVLKLVDFNQEVILRNNENH